MKNAEAVLAVKFKSSLDPNELIKICNEDLNVFRKVPGLLQKYYIAEDGTGALSGIYLFETKNARSSFWSSELAKEIPARYGVIPESLRVEQYDLAIVLK